MQSSWLKYKEKSNYQDLLKSLAIITMITDHLGIYIFPQYVVMRLIGRVAMPIFCFFAGYNFKGKPRTKILFAGIFLYLITSILLNKFMFSNILISIFLGQCYLYWFKNKLYNINTAYIHVFFLVLLAPITCDFTDYGTLVIAIMILGFLAGHFSMQFKAAILVTVFLSLLHSFYNFNFSANYIKIIVIIAVLQYFLFVIKDFEGKIFLNLKFISRYSLFIYVLHLILLQSWYIYLN